jgi:GNAT superfamily N-acetyltransferase
MATRSRKAAEISVITNVDNNGTSNAQALHGLYSSCWTTALVPREFIPEESSIKARATMRTESLKETIDALNYSALETLRDGTAILIRAIRPEDKPRLLQHFQGLSTQSVYYRFFGIKRSLTECDLSRLTELDFTNHVGLAATVGAEERERFIGVGRCIRSESPSRAEVAFAVLDGYQGHGIGTLLLKHLARIAQRNGISEFAADVLASNHQMLEVFANSGFSFHQSYESGIVRVILQFGG